MQNEKQPDKVARYQYKFQPCQKTNVAPSEKLQSSLQHQVLSSLCKVQE